MNLSIIIVSYNVKYFLEQCLCSVMKAARQLDVEIVVIDNQSSDGSIEYLQPKFPQVRFISNAVNTGFARANNQGLKLAMGKFILFLNPDTIIGENSLQDCCTFLESNPGAGALGVKMIDGTGLYLKESKRGFPNTWAAFCKLSGITGLFPHSKLFARYYLGHLKDNELHPVDVLSGAFMMTKKETLDKTGAFDERFFMYAEDIDLSYRIRDAGFSNYYFPGVTIIHFKGESTRKDFHYVKMFYRAMGQFVAKHTGGKNAAIYTALMKGAIAVRSGIAVLSTRSAKQKAPDAHKPINSFLQGSSAEQQVLRRALADTGRIVVEDISKANEIIFCEGDDLSFQQIIDRMEITAPNLTRKIHACKSKSMVGSNFSDNQGETIPLQIN